MIVLENIYIIFLLIIYNIFLYKKDKKIFNVNVFISLVFFLSYVIYLLLIKDYGLNSFAGTIIDIDYYNDYNKLTVSKGLKKVIVYDYYEKEYKYNIGSVIGVSGINIKMEDSRVPMGFSIKKNLLNKGIISCISVNGINEVSEKFNIYILKRVLVDYFNNNFRYESKQFLFALVLGDTSILDDGLNNDIRINGISHLFAISGLHISFLISWIDQIIEKIDKKHFKVIRNILLGVYLFIANFTSSVVRAVFMSYLSQINEKYRLNYSSLDICSLSFIIMVIINPFIVNNVGFQLSFLVAFVIILFSSILNKYNNTVQTLLLSIISFLFTLPIVASINNYINLLSPLVNIIFVYMITVIILPLSFVVSFMPFLDIIYSLVIKIFIDLNSFTSDYISIIIDIPNFHIIETLIYYVLLLVFFKYYNTIHIRKVALIFILFMFVYYNKSYLSPVGEVIFLDLKDGEAILINSKFNDYTILIDTGDGTNSEVTKFLKKKGIRKLDYLILTHNHQDHNGEASLILDEIKVNNIIVGAYDNSRYRYTNKTITVKANDVIEKNGLKLKFISPKENSYDENDNSLIIHTKLGNYEYLFLGDASINVLDKIDIDVDIVKGGHHGSKTSSSYTFYKNTTPKYVILQTGRTKKYNFPDKETIDLLNSLHINILRTDKNATISIYYNKFLSYIKKMYE